MRTLEDDDSDDDSEGDVTFNPDKLPRQPYRMLETSPLLPSATKSHSKILTPMNSKNDDNTPRTTPRRMTQTLRKAQPGSPGQGENIDPKQGQNNGKPSPPRLVVHKPDYGTSDEEEEAVVDKTAPVALDAAEESLAKVGAVQSTEPEPSTPFGDAFERNLDTLPAAPSTPDAKAGPSKRAILRKWRNSPPKTASPAAGPPSPPPSASPEQESPQLPGPGDNVHFLTPKTPRLRYHNWLSSDSIDDADDESHEAPAGHSSRLKKAQAQRIVDETAFLGGDEASVLVADTSVNDEMLNTFQRGGSANEGDEALEENNEHEGTRPATSPEEHVPTPPLRPTLSGSTRVASNSESGTIKRPTGGSQDLQPTYDGAQDVEDDNNHSISSTGSVRRGVQQPTPESYENDDQAKSQSSSPVLQESVVAGQSPTIGSAMANAVDPNSIASTPSGTTALVEAASSTGPLSETNAHSDPESGNSSAMSQDSAGAPNSTNKSIQLANFPGGNPTPRQSFASDATIRPASSPGQLQENSTAAALTGCLSRGSPGGDIDTFPETNYQNSLYSDGFVAHSTPQDYYAGYDIWAIKRSGRGRRVSMNTPPSTLGRSVSGTEFLDNPPEFSSLGSGFSFPSQPLRYEEWDPDSVSREFTPPFPVEGAGGFKRQGLKADRLRGVDAPHNTPTPAARKGSGAPAGWQEGKNIKEGKGRARSKSDPAGKKMGGKGLKRLFAQARVEKEKEEPEYSSCEEEGHDEPKDAAVGVGEGELLAASQGDELDNDEDLVNGDGLDLRFVFPIIK